MCCTRTYTGHVMVCFYSSPHLSSCTRAPGHDCSIRLWNLESKTCIQEFTAHRKKSDESIHDVAFHPSKCYIASAGADSLAKVFVWAGKRPTFLAPPTGTDWTMNRAPGIGLGTNEQEPVFSQLPRLLSSPLLTAPGSSPPIGEGKSALQGESVPASTSYRIQAGLGAPHGHFHEQEPQPPFGLNRSGRGGNKRREINALTLAALQSVFFLLGNWEPCLGSSRICGRACRGRRFLFFLSRLPRLIHNNLPTFCSF